MDTNHIFKFCFPTLPKATRSSGAIFNRKPFHQMFATAENEFSSFLTLINSWWDVHCLVPEPDILEFYCSVLIITVTCHVSHLSLSYAIVTSILYVQI